jgi:hypothetical protein
MVLASLAEQVNMAGPKCPRCAQQITPGDPLAFYGALIFHLDCQRPHTLSREERTLLFRYCWEHVVAKCSACEQRFKQYQLGADLLAHRAYLCPRCRADLTEVCAAISTSARRCPMRFGYGYTRRATPRGGLSVMVGRGTKRCARRRPRSPCYGRRSSERFGAADPNAIARPGAGLAETDGKSGKHASGAGGRAVWADVPAETRSKCMRDLVRKRWAKRRGSK